MDGKTQLTLLDDVCAWRNLTPDIVLKPNSQVGKWLLHYITCEWYWHCEYACDTSVDKLINAYGFIAYRHMNPPIRNKI